MRAAQVLHRAHVIGQGDLWPVFLARQLAGEGFKMQQHGRMVSFFGGRYVLIANLCVLLMACIVVVQTEHVVRVGLKVTNMPLILMPLVPAIVAFVVRHIALSCVYLSIYVVISGYLFRNMWLIETGAIKKYNVRYTLLLEASFHIFALICVSIYFLVVVVRKILELKNR